jgi:acyl dehydratase
MSSRAKKVAPVRSAFAKTARVKEASQRAPKAGKGSAKKAAAKGSAKSKPEARKASAKAAVRPAVRKAAGKPEQSRAAAPKPSKAPPAVIPAPRQEARGAGAPRPAVPQPPFTRSAAPPLQRPLQGRGPGLPVPPRPQPRPIVPGPAGAAVRSPAPPPKPQPTIARSYFFVDLRVGDDLPPLSKPAVDRVQIARFAVEARDLNRLYLDEPFAASLGYRTAVAPGVLAMSFAGQMVTQWLRRGTVRKLAARFVKLVRPGDELTCRGRVADLRREAGECLADLELWAENQKGEAVLRGSATCALLESPAVIPGESGLFSSALRNPPPAQRPLQPRRPLPPPKRR